MKKLLLVRHAKAAAENGTSDFERPLKPSGIEDATVMAQRLHSHHIIPQHIIASPAIRTLTTANIFAEHLGNYTIETDQLIYEAKEDTLFKIITNFPDTYEFVALIGHNPDVSQALQYLTGEAKGVVQCAVAYISFEVESWAKITKDSGNLLYYDEP